MVFIGAGNVATHLAPSLARAGADVRQVMSLSGASARRLAAMLPSAEAIDGPDRLAPADICIIAAKDDAIAEIAASTPDNGSLWLHTSGSVSADVFAPYKSRYGVLYPLQSFSRDREVDLSAVPFFVEGSDEATTRMAEALAASVSASVYRADSRRREALHVAAVFANNFVNHLLAQSEELLAKADLPLSILFPLIDATVEKIKHASPADCQTGPASRGDMQTISRHLAGLDGMQADIYRLITGSILNSKQDKAIIKRL